METRISGLSDEHAAHSRSLIVRQAEMMVAHKGVIHYSQGANRMVGIQNHLSIIRGEFPRTCDCSSAAYWMHFDAVHRPYGVRDLLNGANWNPNVTCYTGSMYKHGKLVQHDANLKIGDIIYYGDQGGGIPEHEAVYVGGMHVFSNGSEGGPYILPIDYRKDRRMAKRYI